MRMRLSPLYSPWLGFSALTYAAAVPIRSTNVGRREVDLHSVRAKLARDMSGRGGDPPDKYFHESVFHPHYDGRFAEHQQDYVERKLALTNLIQTYLATFSDLGIETWIMHGTLLGWWWNRKIMPWDSDLDVQVAEESMYFMAAYYNMSVYHFATPRIPEGRDYMLEINPHYTNGEQTDNLNVIDARWVDTTTGLFIDITTVRKNPKHPKGPGMLSCKDKHEYEEKKIFPLRDTFFEGQAAKIPYSYAEILTEEYGEKSLTQTYFENHHFDETKLEWVPITPSESLRMNAEALKKEQEEKAKARKEAAEKEKSRVSKMEESKKEEARKEAAEKEKAEKEKSRVSKMEESKKEEARKEAAEKEKSRVSKMEESKKEEARKEAAEKEKSRVSKVEESRRGESKEGLRKENPIKDELKANAPK